MVFGDGTKFNNVKGKILARITPTGLQYLKQSDNSVNIGNISVITGGGNNVNQSRFDNLRDTSIKQTAKPIAYENRQNAMSSWLQKFWWQLLIPLIIGLIILYIDKNW